MSSTSSTSSTTTTHATTTTHWTTTTVTTMGPTTTSTTIAYFPRGVYDHDSSASGHDIIVATGFTLLDLGTSRQVLDSLPAGVKALVWLGDYDNTTCTWEQTDASIRSHLAAIAGHPAIGGYFLADEPHRWDCPTAATDLAARNALVKSLDAGPPTVAVIEPHSPGNPYAPYVGTVDVIGADRYPCSYQNGCVYSKIDDAVALLEQAGVPHYWGVIQAFSDSYYRMPTADELHQEFDHWRLSRMEGYLVFSWVWNNDTLENHPDLLQALAEENAR